MEHFFNVVQIKELSLAQIWYINDWIKIHRNQFKIFFMNPILSPVWIRPGIRLKIRDCKDSDWVSNLVNPVNLSESERNPRISRQKNSANKSSYSNKAYFKADLFQVCRVRNEFGTRLGFRDYFWIRDRNTIDNVEKSTSLTQNKFSKKYHDKIVGKQLQPAKR